jgi:uncharacterized protein YgiM (DUF1202 family)
MNSYLIFGLMLSGSLLAQQATDSSAPPKIETPAAAPAVTDTNAASLASPESPATNAPAAKKKPGTKKKPQKKSAVKKKQTGAELKTVPLVPGPAVVAANHVNVRGQPKLKSEIVTRLSKDQNVTVIEEITRNNSGPDEPSAWAKIALPSEVHVWVNTGFIDASTKSVKPKKLNVRSGPGENFSVLGRLERGETVNQISAKGDWLEIDAPTNAYAYVAAQYLKQEPAAPAVAPATVAETVPTPAAVTNETPLVAAPTEAPGAAAPTQPTADTNAVAEASTNAPNPAAAEEPPPKRIVEREGIVRGTSSIQAPTRFELISPDNHRTIDYLYTPSIALDLRRYKGLRIIVTGEEGLEERWGNTPVITIQKIQVIE